MSLPALDPQAVAELLKNGAALIDVRSLSEYRKKHIPGALCLPAELVRAGLLPEKPALVFACRSGRRTGLLADAFGAQASARPEGHGSACQLAGGLVAWERAGLPTEGDPKAPIEIMRQVQIVAGGLILAGAVLGYACSPWWFLVPTFVGAGLLFAGISGFCGMALLLMNMPWNRR